MSAVRSVLVRAPGKVNVSMRVGAPMDDGYHDVATAYQAVSLYEELRAERDTELSLDFSGPILTGSLPVDRTNLVIRAAHLLQARSGYRGGARIHVVKRVPIAGGMGGGSADAAAALVGLAVIRRVRRGGVRHLALLAVARDESHVGRRLFARVG